MGRMPSRSDSTWNNPPGPVSYRQVASRRGRWMGSWTPPAFAPHCDMPQDLSQTAADSPPSARRSPGRRSRVVLLGALVLGLAGVWTWREPLRHFLSWHGALANDAPPADLVEELIVRAPDSSAALRAAWQTGKIVHRQAAVRAARRVFPSTTRLPKSLESLLLAAALDPDHTVRETALRDLGDRAHPALPGLLAAQLQDADPQIRLLALQMLKGLDPARRLPLLRPALDDPDPLVVVSALKLLERWSGAEFGVKLADLRPLETSVETSSVPPDVRRQVHRAAARARDWWATQSGLPDLPSAKTAYADPLTPPAALPAPDFELPTLEGDKVRLSALRGRVVLLNFWTTWCTACLAEIPVLTALRNRHDNHLVILGISLDAVPDSHGHLGEHQQLEEQHGKGVPHAHETGKAAWLQVREKVIRTAKARGINYPVLLDVHSQAGGRYNGGELPTTVIVDPRGFVRRRFVGARNLPVFEAMIAEAEQLPAHAITAVDPSASTRP